MNPDEMNLLRQMVEAQSQCEEIRIRTTDLVRKMMGKLRPLDEKWSECRPHSAEENQWYRDRAASIRLEIEDLAPLQIAINENMLIHIEKLRQMLATTPEESDFDGGEVLLTMRDFAQRRLDADFPELLREFLRIRDDVAQFEMDVDKKCHVTSKVAQRRFRRNS